MPAPASGARRPRRAIAASLVALAAALVVAGPANADFRSFRPGVTELPERAGADLAGMGESGVEVLRTNLSWLRIETERPSSGSCNATYDSAAYDQIVRGASLYGVHLLPVIVGSPGYVASAGTHAPNTRKPREIDAYKCFVRAAGARYGRNGDLPTAEGVRPITEWQVWNEPNFSTFAVEERGVDPREYAHLVEVTSRQLRSVDPRARLVLAGMPTTSSGLDANQFLRGVYRKRRIERSFDAVALHPYARNHRGVKGAVLRLRHLLRRVNDRNRSIWITEVGWSTQGKSLDFLIKDRQGQAEQLKKTFELLRGRRRSWNIGTVNWFRWRDTATPSEDRETFDYAGLYSKGGSPKPSCRRFASIAGGSCGQLP